MSQLHRNNKLDEAGFKDLHDRYKDRLRWAILRAVRNETVAEDITAKAFANAFEKRDSFRGNSSAATWLHAIAFNEIRAWAKRRNTVSLEAMNGSEPDALVECDGAAGLERSADLQNLRDALNRLPANYRRVLVDHFITGSSIKEIARRSRIPSGTVLSRIFTAKKLLWKAWART